MKWKGQISVFLSLILICVCGLICGLLESARTAGARCYLQTAAHSSMDSLFSQYHRALWEEYRIFGLEHKAEEDISQEFSEFLKPYLEQDNWYPFELKTSQVTGRQLLTDDSGEYFEKEIMDYMKYGIWTKEWDGDSAAQALKTLTEASQVSELTRSMEIQTKDAWKLERTLEDLGSCLEEQKAHQDTAARLLDQEDGSGFCREGDRLIRKLKKVPGLVEKYEKQADELGKKLGGLKKQYEEKSADLSSSVQASFQSELFEYEAYTDKDGERRKQIVGLSTKSENRIALVEAVQQEAEEVEDYIDSWEPEDEDDELDTAALWAPVQAHFAQYEALFLPVQAGVKDKEKEGLLKRLREMADKGILSLVLPEGAEVSKGSILTGQYPSGRIAFEEKGLGLLEQAMTAEYCQVFCNHFCDTGEKETAYEMEYLLFGNGTDKENLVQTVEMLLAVREGMNLIHILGDSEKRSQAKTLAASVVGASGLLPLVSITAFLIMGVWAFGEAVADIRALLSGGKVSILKGKEDWCLSLDGLLEFAARGKVKESESRESGLSYPQYLTIFLLVSPGTRMLYRMMDVIEMNLSRKQKGFQLSNCAYRVDIQTETCGKHVYFALGLLKSIVGSTDITYPLTVDASRAY
ncbi:MAG: DUF5702 domain-containing protein [Lachnospiraceae bacterium]|nr:DUF5702 domain-containing protein [Lachnospiraceae bacterium]